MTLIRGISAFTLVIAGSTPAFATDFVFCRGNAPSGDAFLDQNFSQPAPQKLQYICSLPTVDPAQPRCTVSGEHMCVEGSGGKATSAGPHDVARESWYHSVSSGNYTLQVRCQCGCFAPETKIWTTQGEYAVSALLTFSSRQPIFTLVRADANDVSTFVPGSALRSSDFTVGPETKPMVKIETNQGHTMILTDNHPVLVLRELAQQFVRADEVELTDRLLDKNGDPASVSRLSSYVLPANQKVINFSSKDKSDLAHIVVSDGLQVGDNYWQQKINALRARVGIRKEQNTSYLNAALAE